MVLFWSLFRKNTQTVAQSIYQAYKGIRDFQTIQVGNTLQTSTFYEEANNNFGRRAKHELLKPVQLLHTEPRGDYNQQWPWHLRIGFRYHTESDKCWWRVVKTIWNVSGRRMREESLVRPEDAGKKDRECGKLLRQFTHIKKTDSFSWKCFGVHERKE